MDQVTFETYVKERYEKQMDYYRKASEKNQKRYRQFQWILIVLSAITPVIAALSSFNNGHDATSDEYLNFIVVIISSTVAILTTGLKTFNYQELWIMYRLTYEKLKPEIHYYYFSVGEYGHPGIDKESLFVSRIEALLDTEHAQWPPAKKLQGGANNQEDFPDNNPEASMPISK